tara:strand:- start:367 stop:603 length:237 start_codon:yes stop_codon:yes gene_type:complete
MIKTILFLGLGFLGGLCVPWPGIVKAENFNCVKELVMESNNAHLDIRTLSSISMRNVLKGKNQTTLERVRIVGDTCFR